VIVVVVVVVVVVVEDKIPGARGGVAGGCGGGEREFLAPSRPLGWGSKASSAKRVVLNISSQLTR
jgi:hypothetical protein